MNRYDPDVSPDSTAWLALDESERLIFVEEYHAVGSVLAEHIYHLLQARSLPAEGHAPYYAALQQLTAEKWRGG